MAGQVTFGPPETGNDGAISIWRSPDKVIYIRWEGEGPAEPPTGKNWLVPQEGCGAIRFMYHPGLGQIVFCHFRLKDHAVIVSNLANEFGLSLPHFDEWVRADSWRKGDDTHIRTDEDRLGPKSAALKTKFRNFGRMLTRLRTLEAVPCDYPVRMDLARRGRVRTRVRDWCKCCEGSVEEAIWQFGGQTIRL